MMVFGRNCPVNAVVQNTYFCKNVFLTYMQLKCLIGSFDLFKVISEN